MSTTYKSDIANFLLLGIKEVWKKNLQPQRKIEYTGMVTPKKSDKSAEYYDTVGNIKPAQVVGESQVIPYNKIKQAYRVTVTNDKVANGFQVSLEASQDDLYNVVSEAQANGLRRTMIAKKERAVASTYDGLFTNTGGDGVASIASNHPLIDSALTNDNLASGALTPDNVIAANNKFNHIYDQSGELFDTEGTQIIAHKDKMALVLSILESALKAQELSNTKNTVPALKPYFNRYINATKWYIRDEVIDSVILQERIGLQASMTQDKINTLDYFFTIYERYKCSVINPSYGIVGSLGT